jgi:hypothetical protein
VSHCLNCLLIVLTQRRFSNLWSCISFPGNTSKFSQKTFVLPVTSQLSAKIGYRLVLIDHVQAGDDRSVATPEHSRQRVEQKLPGDQRKKTGLPIAVDPASF